MITLVELWYAWCDIDEHTEVELRFEGDEDFITFKFGERKKWKRYDKSIVSVFSVMQVNQTNVTHSTFDKVVIILKG